MVKGGRHLTFNAMVVVGDGAGNVGSGLGKAGAVPDAVRKGTSVARKEMHPIKLKEATIPHEMVAKYGAAKVLLMPAAPGTGIIAGGGVRAVMEAAGVRDVLSKTYGSSNTINIVKATMRALDQMRDPVAETRRRRNFGAPPPPVYTSSIPPSAVAPSVPAPVVTPSIPAPVVTPSIPAPIETASSPAAPVDTSSAPAPVDTSPAPAPVDKPPVPAPVDTASAPASDDTPPSPPPAVQTLPST